MTTKDAFYLIKEYFNEQHLGICSLGRTAEECFLNLPHNQILYLDCLGSVTDTAVGVSLGCPNIWIDAFDTDGSFLSNLACTYTIATLQENLSHFTLFIFDNQILESGGGKKSRIIDLNWKCLFKIWGISPQLITNSSELSCFLSLRSSRSLPQIAILSINNENIPNSCTKNIDGKESKYMFKRYINENFKEGILKPCLKN